MKTRCDHNTTETEATQMAFVLAQRLNFHRLGWEIEIYQTLGWNYHVIHRKYGIRVFPAHKNGEFFALLIPSYSNFYSPEHKTFRDPVEAVREVVNSAKRYAEEINEHVNKFESYFL